MVGLALTTFASCSDNEAQPFDEPEVNSDTLCYVTVPDTTKTLTAERAMMIAARHSGTGADSRTAGRLPASIDAVNDEDGNPLMYVVNYTDNKGFVILSASKEYYPILAESDEGSFDLRNLEPEHPVNLWLDEQKFLVEHIDALPDSVKTRAASLWMEYNYDRAAVSAAIDSRANYPEKPQVYYDSLRRWTLDPNIEVYTYEDYINTMEYQSLEQNVKDAMIAGMNYAGNSNYGPITSSTLVLRRINYNYFSNQLTTTEWAQRNGFESSIPYEGKRLGCGPVAVGQFMKFHKYPTYLHWDEMHDKIPTTATTDFLYQIGLKMDIDYSKNSFDKGSDDVAYALRLYGYLANPPASHDKYKVLSEVKGGHPVILFGNKKSFLGISSWDGHAWVCDGAIFGDETLELRVMTIDYRPTIYSTPDLMVEAYKGGKIMSYTPLRFHFNWGWGGYRNGYFDDSNIQVEDSEGEVHDYKHGRKDLFARPNPNLQ